MGKYQIGNINFTKACIYSFFHFVGTGSGLGTSVLNLLAEEYPDVYRFTTAVYPSADDDVITSPYNRCVLQTVFHYSMLATIPSMFVILSCFHIENIDIRSIN